MFCKACSKIVSYGDELKDEKGCIHDHRFQVCGKCRPKDQMSEREVRLLIQEKIRGKSDATGNTQNTQ